MPVVPPLPSSPSTPTTAGRAPSVHPRTAPEETGFDVTLSRVGAHTDVDRMWPGLLRRVGNTCLDSWGMGGVRDDFGLLLSELATNGFRHGGGPTVRVRVWRTGHRVGIEVGGGTPRTPFAAPAPASPLAEGGRGLHLVGAFADAWGVTPDGTTTWCLLPDHPQGGADRP
ncbi:ATP-binding protein [Streptomyces sp. NPDC002454]